MKLQKTKLQKDGFYGAYFKNTQNSDTAFIMLLGDDVDDRMALLGVKWALNLSCNVLTMAPAKKDYGYHNYPLENFEYAIEYLKKQGNKKIGIAGASATGMMALVAASYFSDITLTLAFTPCDFIMEGFYQDGLDGVRERPGDNESTVSYRGVPLPYLPYAYRHPLYWQMIKEESKESGNMIASRKMFDKSELLHPIRDEEKIKIERINGKVIFVGAEDDALWNTCKYIQRMENRLRSLPHRCKYESWIYKHGTHFVFPQSMLKNMLTVGSDLIVRCSFKAGREFAKECKNTRIDIDRRLNKTINQWKIEAE
ncbi:MAG: acyl-CoA thioester hydrolase/BAAT C-terminal domain-containing protein [Ruminococcus sp.]